MSYVYIYLFFAKLLTMVDLCVAKWEYLYIFEIQKRTA